MNYRALVVFVLFIGIAETDCRSQVNVKKEMSALSSRADYVFNDGNYYSALPLYLRLLQYDSTNTYFRFQAGVCYLFTDDKTMSISFLQRVYKDQPDMNDILYYLGRAYHLNYQFDTAISYFQRYLATHASEEKKANAKNYINYCNNAKELTQHPVKIKIMNLGSVINSPWPEYAPVITTDESEIIFTYKGPQSTGGLEDPKFRPDSNGEYYEDIFMAQKLGSNWLAPEKVTDLCTKGNDASIALSIDGQTLFSFRSTPQDGGDIFMSKLDGNAWTQPVNMGSNINTKFWEGSCSITSNGQTLYFASERPGGFGGRDIYYSNMQKDGSWGPAVNLGSNINTPLNDDAPFIHPDNITLFFSSEGWNSMGGYDIFYSTMNPEDSSWNTPVNMGYPLNSPDDDRYYVLSADGSRGYFSSNRKGGYGQQDIYDVTPGYRDKRPLLALTVGVVTVDQQPRKADIDVTNTKTNRHQGTYQSNFVTGKYIIALTPGTKYKIAVEVAGVRPHIEYLDIDSLDTFIKVQDSVNLYTSDYLQSHPTMVADTSSGELQKKVNKLIADYKSDQNITHYKAKIYQRILNNYGSADSAGVSYRLELGSYKNPSDFDSTKFKGMGTIHSRKDAEGNTTYYVDSLRTMLDAEILKYKIIAHDSSLKKQLNVTVDNQGKSETIEKFYVNEYQKEKTDFVPDSTIPLVTKAPTSLTVSDTGDVVAPPVAKAKIKRVKTAKKPPVAYGEKKTHVAATPDSVRFVRDVSKISIDGLEYKLELGVVSDTNQFKLGGLSKYGTIKKEKFPDGTYHYYMGPFKTLADAGKFKDNLTSKDPQASKSVIMVFYFGKEKTVKDFFNDANPCEAGPPQDFSVFSGKDLNDTSIYNKLISMAGDICIDSLTFRVQIAAYRHPRNYRYSNLMSLIPPIPLVEPYPDGITRFTLREFKTIKLAELFRQAVKKKGTRDAWITAVYKGKRMLLQELIALNFYTQRTN